jgi:hypothetical protein
VALDRRFAALGLDDRQCLGVSCVHQGRPEAYNDLGDRKIAPKGGFDIEIIREAEFEWTLDCPIVEDVEDVFDITATLTVEFEDFEQRDDHPPFTEAQLREAVQRAALHFLNEAYDGSRQLFEPS